MYKVLLVDDEKLSRDSIASLVEWDHHELQLIGAAKNGFEALDLVDKELPDIVITDIKMPVMSGLELIGKIKEKRSDIIFVVLSGYDEYEYMSEAMRYGIKHYLLKPCNEIQIIEVLNEIKQEIASMCREREFFAKLNSNFNRVLPHVKEQFLKDIALTGTYNQRDFEEFMAMFHINVQSFQLVLVQFGESRGYLEKFALKNIAEDLFTSEKLYLSSVVDESVLLLVQSMEFEKLAHILNEVRDIYKSYYRLELFMGVSGAGGFKDIRSMYKEVQDVLRYRFYFTEGCLLTSEDVQVSTKSAWQVDFNVLFEDIAASIKAGNLQDLSHKLQSLFDIFENKRMEINEVKSHCMELYMIVIRQGQQPPTSEKMFQVVKFQELDTLHATFEFLRSVSETVAISNYQESSTNQNKMISSVIRIVDEHLGNPELSLTWIGKELLYVNVDYLGRLFSKETGVKFSQFVLERRMEQATRLIEQAGDLKIYEISKLTGFREDTQYFSKVFKKYTGFTPTEYKRNFDEGLRA
ncbi:response regulator [Paenibacillus sp. LjRoot153]|uniref:response regulator transcription factor n=1 Tax=Paenibacillus sp. LjRoot153 TaxID=3342270 RepID=UPI003ECC773C